MLGTDDRKRSPITLPGYRRGQKPANAGKTYPAEVYSRQEVEKVLRQLARGYLGLRNRAIVVTLWRCGLRIEEALALDPEDIDLLEGTLLVRHGKNNRQRTLGLDHESIDALATWLERREELGFTPDQPLFPVCYGVTRGKPIYSSDFRDALSSPAAAPGFVGGCIRTAFGTRSPASASVRGSRCRCSR